MVASGITNVSAIKNADGTYQISWTDSLARPHSVKVDMNSDMIGLLFLMAKAVNTGVLT